MFFLSQVALFWSFQSTGTLEGYVRITQNLRGLHVYLFHGHFGAVPMPHDYLVA
jgi:hypothetical protein